MTLGSLFDGSGTALLSAVKNGITPVWASEIEPFAIKVAKHRFPNVTHYGDINKINGAEIQPVDIIVGGSPCTDLSIAGNRDGLENGRQSHLFFDMVRVIKEMREATHGEYPKYVVWENVTGAFSSNNGRDFYEVIKRFSQIADPNVYVPEPQSGGGKLRWAYSGEMVGEGFSIAWRTMDAQYWGVPQRRRRVYLCASYSRVPYENYRSDFVERLRAERAGEILFERESLRGNNSQSRDSRQTIARHSEESS